LIWVTPLEVLVSVLSSTPVPVRPSAV